MSVQLQIDEMPGYLIARFIGAGATEEVERQFESLAEKCKSTSRQSQTDASVPRQDAYKNISGV